jgi:hypothetical protein
MANLRGGVTPDRRGEATRLSSQNISVWANTWTRRVEVGLSKDGRVSITVTDDKSYRGHDRTILAVELPCNEGEDKDSFTPIFKYRGIELTPAILAQMLGKPEAPLPLLEEN